MKRIALILISPNIPVPPKGWGAIEKYMWEYKINLEKLGHTVELRYPDASDLKTFDIVQVHTWNQALLLYKKDIPYVFSFDDTHVLFHGKDSDLYKNNLEAIRKSEITIVHGEYLLEYFNEPNMVYLRHGANPEVFKPLQSKSKSHSLLCVGRTDQDDRKGLLMAIKAAKNLDLPITVVGPNDHFFKNSSFTYDKLTLIGNTDDEGLTDLYNSHTIFLHPSKLETGHPNLTLIESIYCSTPVVGTCNIPIKGMVQITPSLSSLIEGIQKTIDHYDNYLQECYTLKSTHHYDWSSITSDLLSIYLSLSDMKQVLIKEYSSTSKLSIPSKGVLPQITLDFTDGPKCTINNGGDKSYEVEFINTKTNKIVYKTSITNNMWAKVNKKYFVPWSIKVTDLSNSKLVCNHTLNLKDKKVFIKFESKAVGDTIAWLPYVEEFRQHHQCQVICSTFHNEWFVEEYPDIKFVLPGTDISTSYQYKIGWFFKGNTPDTDSHKTSPLLIPLQQTASDILGLPFKETPPKINLPLTPPSIKEKYVTLSVQSTAQAKYWNYKGGWVKVVNFLNQQGYKVVCIDKHSIFGAGECMNHIPPNTIDKTGCTFSEAASLIKGAEFHMGVSSGLSWLSWALGTHVVMVSSFSKPFCEFTTNCTRIYNDTIFSGYYNNPDYRFDPGNWNWNPFLELSTLDEWHDFETITPEQVINEIKQIL